MKREVFDDTTFFIDNRILIRFNKNDLKNILETPKNNYTKIKYLVDVFLFYREDLLEIFTNLEKNDASYSYLKFFFEMYSNKETFFMLFERTSYKTLKQFFERCFIPSDDFYDMTINLKNELRDEEKFLNDKEFDIIFKNEVINILKEYTFKI